MRSAINTPLATRGQIGVAFTLLVGVLAIAYGLYHPNRIAFVAGLIVTAGGVISGVVQMVTRKGNGESRSQ